MSVTGLVIVFIKLVRCSKISGMKDTNSDDCFGHSTDFNDNKSKLKKRRIDTK